MSRVNFPTLVIKVVGLSEVSSVVNNILYISLGIKIKPFVSCLLLGTPVVSGTVKTKGHVLQFLLLFIVVSFGLSIFY